MRNNAKYILIISAILLIYSCATTQPADEKKYDMDDQLELVSDINKYRLISWETVDHQSFVLKTGVSECYLIVLIRPSSLLMSCDSISISSTGSTVKSGFDDVTVVSSGMKESYRIHKIYKLKDSQQTKEIKAQLSGKK